MSRTTRDQFMSSIRNALGRARSSVERPIAPNVDQSLVRLAGADDDLPGLFAARAAEVGMVVRRTTVTGLLTQLLDVLREIGARSATVAVARVAIQQDIQAALERSDIELRPWESDRSMAAHYQVDAGITDAHAALAETGTLICHSDAHHGRGHSLVPPVHIAIVRATDVLPDLLDYVASLRARPSELPSGIALITGPSKTADIEGILITGVHGPGRVFVLLVEDL